MAIKRIDGKETKQYTLEEYDGRARPAELVIDLETYNVFVGNTNGDLLPIGGGGGNVVSIPPVYFTTLAGGNNQSFTDAVLTAYTSNLDITLFHNGVLLENTFYVLNGDTLTINIPLNPNDTIEVIRQFAGGNVNAAISIPPIYFVAPITGNNQNFSNVYLSAYTSNTDLTVFKNGVFIENNNYTLSGDILTVNIDLNAGDTIDVARQFAARVIEQPTVSIPALYFVAPTTANNQTFSNVYLSSYTSNLDLTVFKNGVLLENTTYTLTDDTLTINTNLNQDDTVYVIRQFASSVVNVDGDPSGPEYSLQFNNAGTFGGIPNVKYLSGNLLLGNVANIKISGGTSGQVLTTDGNGTLSWTDSGSGFVTIPAINFVAPTTANNQSFSNVELLNYVSNTDVTLFLNGSLLDSGFYTLTGDTITITTPIDTGDSVDIISRVATAPTTLTLYEPGQVIKVSMLDNIQISQAASTLVANTGTYQTFASYVYTPESNNSYIIVEYVTAYSMPSGSGTDDWYSQITVNGGEIGYVRQSWNSEAGGGTRSGVLFPVMGRYTNTNTEAKVIQIRARSGASNDMLTIFGDTSSWLKITEISR